MKLLLLAILIAGSPAFGLEALLIGKGGKLTTNYTRNQLLKVAILLGLGIVGTSALFEILLEVHPLYLVALILALTFLTGGIISLKNREEPDEKKINNNREASDDEIKSMLKNRGLDQLIKDEEETREENQGS